MDRRSGPQPISVKMCIGTSPSRNSANRSIPPANHDGDIVPQPADAGRIPERRFQCFLSRWKPSRSAVITAGDGPVRFPPINDVGDMSNHVPLPETAYSYL